MEKVKSRRFLEELELETPPRPRLILGGMEPHLGYGPYQKSDPSISIPKMYRLTWSWMWSTKHAIIERFQIFTSVQRIKSSYATKWTKIGEISCKGGNQRAKVEDGTTPIKLAVSRRIIGFVSGFRYQFVVRGVDVCGREGSFSIPVQVQVY